MYIRIRAIPDSKKEEWVKEGDDLYRVSIKEKAEGGKANKKIVEIVREKLKITGQIKIVSGHTSTTKILSIPD